VLRQQQGHERGDVRRGKRVAGGHGHAAVAPGDRHVNAPRPELDRRLGVVEEPPRIRIAVRRDADHRAEQRRVAGAGHVVRGAHQHHALEIGLVGELVEDRKEGVALARQAQVGDAHGSLDRVVEGLGEGRSLPLEV